MKDIFRPRSRSSKELDASKERHFIVTTILQEKVKPGIRYKKSFSRDGSENSEVGSAKMKYLDEKCDHPTLTPQPIISRSAIYHEGEGKTDCGTMVSNI
jgi:hypothetical protein